LKFLHDLRLVVVIVGATASGDLSVFESYREVASKALNSMDLIEFNGSLSLTARGPYSNWTTRSTIDMVTGAMKSVRHPEITGNS
jgi:hypothetical protein